VVAGNNALIHETLGGLQIKNNDVLELDIAEFLHLNRELTALAKNTPDKNGQKLERLQRMVSLYRGELMDGSDYGNSVSLERERCKVIFEDACLKLGVIYAQQGEPVQAEEILRRALALEPYGENLCLELLRLFMSQGMRSKAVSLYSQFKKRFEQELGIKIDGRLTEAVHKSKLGPARLSKSELS